MAGYEDDLKQVDMLLALEGQSNAVLDQIQQSRSLL